MKRFILIIALSSVVSTQSFLFSQEKKEPVVVIEEAPTPELSVVNNILSVKNARVGSRIEIISIVGNRIDSIEMKTTSGTYELRLPKAIYIFKLEGVVRKFVIR